jgi:hypothetical protein
MKTLPILALALCAVPVRADLSYDIRETTIAHPSLGMKTKESLAHLMIQGASVAIRQNDIVQVQCGTESDYSDRLSDANLRHLQLG